jgi:hypothetical protein
MHLRFALLIFVAALVLWYLFKRSDAAGAAPSQLDELDYLNEADLPASPPSANDSGAGLEAYTPLANAIANAEGFGKDSSIPTRANNPGDLELGNVGFGTVTARGGQQITVFGSVSDGWAALNNQISKIFSGRSRYYKPEMSLQEFGSIYSGGSRTYGANLAAFLGLTPDAPLSQANAS